MIRSLALHIIGNAAALYFIGEWLEGNLLVTGGWEGYVIAALIFGVLNSFVKPVIKILAIPIMFLTAGLFTFLINMFLVWFAQYALGVLDFEGVEMIISGGWVTYLYIGLGMSIVNIILHWLTKK